MTIFLKLAKINISVQLLIVLCAALLFGPFMPESLQSFFYAISLTLKGFLLFVLPAIIFSCLFSCLLTFRGGKALGFMLVLFVVVCLSNYLATLIAYSVASLGLVELNPLITPASSLKELQPLWEVAFPKWVSNEVALYLGFGLGSLFSFFPSARAYQFSVQAKRIVTLFLEKTFIPVLPFFALGFILKMQYDGVLSKVIGSYLPILFIILVTYMVYLALIFAVVASFNFKRWLEYIKNVLPAALMGLSTMSSLATMPVTLKAAEKNTGDLDISRSTIPATVNIHLIGVSIAIPFMALAILSSFGYEFPKFTFFSRFAFDFVLAQFSIAAVPGGGIYVMLPLLEEHFAFSAEMSGLITALYILFDPFVTVANVLGNSGLVIMISKIFGKSSQKAAIVSP